MYYIDGMNYVPSIPIWFNTRKAAQVVAFFAAMSGGKINILKVSKLVYLSDRKSLDQRECPITNDNYVSMEFGPVNSCTYNYMKGVAPSKQEDWMEFIGTQRGNDIPLSKEIELPDDLDELSQYDLRIMNEIWDEFKDTDRFDIAEWTHKFCPEWKDPQGSSIPIELAAIFHAQGKEDPVDLANDLQLERQMVAEHLSNG